MSQTQTESKPPAADVQPALYGVCPLAPSQRLALDRDGEARSDTGQARGDNGLFGRRG